MFKTLKEFLREDDEDLLGGAGKIKDSIKKGWKNAAERHKSAIKDTTEAEKNAERAQKAAEKAAEKAVKDEKKIADKSEKEAEAAAKASAAEHKLKTAETISELRKDIDTFVSDFFDRFPFYGGAGGAEDILDKYQTREAALEAFKVFKGLSDRLTQLLKGFNASLVSHNKVKADQVKRYTQQANRLIAASGNPAIPQALIKFVRAEAKFFKRLIKIDDDFKLDADDFRDLLTMKINQTDAARVPDAAQALNLLFTYMADEFRGHARVIADVGRTMDDENTATKRTTRDAAAAKAAAEVEANAKSNGR